MKTLHFKTSATIILVASALSAIAQVPITNGLVAYYPFNGNVNDASGNGNTGYINGTDWLFSSDRFGETTNALYLNTTPLPTNDLADYDGAYAVVPRSTALDFNQDFTLSVWVNLADGETNYWVDNLISNGSDQIATNLRIIPNPNGPDDYLQFLGDLSASPFDLHFLVPSVRNAWWQAVVVHSGNELSLFRNGVLLTNAVIPVSVALSPTIWFGQMQPSSGWCPCAYYSLLGGIDDIAMFSRALSTNEVMQLYHQGYYQSPPQIVAQPQDQVGYWGFGESISVGAVGSQPLSYQWLIDGFPIPWATNAILDYTNLNLSDAGTYEVEITNLYGSVLSEPATLIVNPAGVSLAVYPGLTITGAVGKTFGIQYSTNLALSNGWATLSSLALTQSSVLWFDTNATIGAIPQRYYRVVAIP